jgi:uncharacterized OB-fold protein
MFSQSLLWDIMRFEMAMGPSDECHSCGAVFLAHSDGCPSCGSYRTSKLHPLETKQDKWDMETYPIMYWDKEVGFHHINIGDFSSYPKV